MALSARLGGRVAVVTGASSGLGRAISLAFASHGAKLVVCADLRPEPKEGTATDVEPVAELINKKYGRDRALFVKTDVTDGASVQNVVKNAVQLGGRLDIMVNNAGLGISTSDVRLHQQEDEEWNRMLAVNLGGTYFGCKFALQQFMKQDLCHAGRRGWIVNVSSMLGLVGIKGGLGAYCASKGATLNLSKQIAVDYAKDRIHCNALCPGFTKTPMTRVNFENAEVNKVMMDTTPWGEWGKPEEVAKAAVFLASEDAAWVTGVGLPVDGGYLAQ